MSETEGLPTEEFPGEPEPETEDQPDEVPEGVDPETGEVSAEYTTDNTDEEETGDEERRRELAAERQAEEQAKAETEAEIERQGKALDRATKAYLDKLVAALGEDLGGWQPCPMCSDGYPGVRMPMMPSPEQLAKIKVAIGEDPDPPLNPDPYSRQCDHCGGEGRVDMRSHVTNQKSARCIDCDGRGWIPVGPEREGGQIAVGNGVAATPQPVLQDNVSNDPPEVEKLKQLGYIVVEPIRVESVPPS